MNFLAIEEIKKQSVTFINYIKSLFHPIGKYKPINNEAGFKEWLTKNIDPNELEHVLIVEKATSSNYKLDLFSHLFSDELVAAIESTKKSNPKETIIYSNGQVYEDGAEKLGLKIEEFIANNDAYEYLKQTGCLLMTGATGTNVNDLVFLIGGN